MKENTQEWIKQFNTDFQATEEQRDKSNEEIRFAMIPGGQWEGYLEDNFESRAKIELDQTSDYLYRTYSQWTENRVSVNYSAEDDAHDDDAELLDGLWRRDIRRNGGQSSIDTAVFEAIACGVGAFHISTEYEDEEDPDDEDKCCVFNPLTNAYSTVIWDSGAKRKDKADANHCTLLIPHSPEGFAKKYPDVEPAGNMQPQDRRWFNWTTPKVVYEGIRYEVVIESTTVYTYGNPMTMEKVQVDEEDLEDSLVELEANGYERLSVKKIKKRRVYKACFSGENVLEKPRRIAGKFIPVIPLVAYSAHIDGVDYWHGVVRKRMDGQRLLNMSASLMAEAAASSTEDKPIFAPEQVQNVKTLWAQNRHQKPYLLAEPIRDQEGNISHVGPVGVLPGSTQAQSAQTLMDTVRQIITQGTGGAPQDTLDTEASGKAINAILRRVDMNVQPIFDNIQNAMQHAGNVYRHIAAEIYSERAGRSVNLVNERGDTRRVKLMEQRGAANGELTYGNNPARGKFEVVVDTGPSFQTQREETVVALKDIVAAMVPQDPLRQLVLGKLIELMPAQGMDDLKDYIHKEQLRSGIAKPETDEDFEYLQAISAATGEQTAEDRLVDSAALNQRMEAFKRAKELEEIDANIISKKAKAAKDMADAEAQAIENGAVRSGIMELVSGKAS